MAKRNPVERYLSPRGIHAVTDLRALVREKTGEEIRWATIQDVAQGRVRCSARTAALLHRATAGAIDAMELIGATVVRRRARAA